MDFIGICSEEVALEGLDGITLSALWLRLENTRPKFPINLDDASKNFLWKAIVGQSCLEFYKLPAARPPLVLYDRFAFSDPDTGIIIERPDAPECIYPIKIIDDKENGIVGSCVTYDVRTNITEQIRDSNLKMKCLLKEAVEKYGNQLVIVASQQRRNEVLFGSSVDPSLVIPAKHFCVLERIGRARYEGEITQGKNSLKVFETSSSLFYIRKSLAKHNILTTQVFNLKLARGNNTIGKLVHLKRFYVQRRPVYLGLLETLTKVLAQKPQQMEELKVIRNDVGLRESTFKKLYQYGCQYVKVEMIPYRQMFPSAPEKDYMIKVKTKERFIRVLKLVKEYHYRGPGEDEEEDEEEGEEDEDGPCIPTSDVVKWQHLREEPLLQQVFRYCYQQGERGVTQNQVSCAFGVNKLESRLLCRNLERMHLVKKVLQDIGKQRVQFFFAKDFVADSRLLKKIAAEKNKIINLKKEATEWEMTDSSPAGTPCTSRSATPVPTPKQTPDKSRDSEEEETDVNSPLPFTDDVLTSSWHGRKKGAHVTYRMLRRATIILEAVREAKLIDNIFNVQRKIIEEEMAEGCKQRLDKKSLMRLIQRLAREGRINSIKTVIKFGKDEKQLHFICDANISANDQIVKSAIEMSKLKYMALSKEVTREIISSSKKEAEVNLGSGDPNRPNYALLRSRLETEDMEYDPEAGRRYGYVPRMKRCQVVHEVLWYLVYGYGQTAPERSSEVEKESETMTSDLQNLFKQVQRSEHDDAASACVPQLAPLPSETKAIQIGASHECDESIIYADEMTWRRFLPPLPQHPDYGTGWCLIGDVLMLLPVSLFCKIIRVNFKIRDLEDLLNDPEKCYLPVSKLPTLMRQQLMYGRKFVFNFSEICTLLCQMGMLSFGKREWKEKEQIFVYVHKNVSVMDSTNIDVPVEDRKIQSFQLNTFKDLNDFWFALQLVCINTPPNILYQSEPDPKSTIKPSRFNNCLQGKTPDEITDDGTIPGNLLGAGGLDSSLFVHMRRNWTTNPNMDVKVESLLRKKVTKITPVSASSGKKKRNDDNGAATKEKAKSKKLANVQVQIVDKAAVQKGGKGLKRKAADPVAAGLSPPGTKLYVRQPKERTKPVKKKIREYDEIDKAALRRMTKERVAWYAAEDSLLLVCEVAHLFMVGNRRDFIVPFSTVRDIMHEKFQTSLDKTSVACQRRLRYMLKNPQTVSNVSMYFGEAMQDKALVKQFSEGKKYLKTNPERNIKVFRELVELLRIKFMLITRSSLGDGVPDIPDTVEELYEKYTCSLDHTQLHQKSKHVDVKRVQDIHSSVLHNAIHSAMLLPNKDCRAHDLYQLFSQYPEDLLLAVFATMKNDGIITKIKFSDPSRPSGRATTIPTIQMGSYQMAQRYTYNWFSRYPKELFLSCSKHLDKMRGVQDSGKTHDDAVLLSEENGGCTALIVSLMAEKKITFETVIPEDIIVVESLMLKKLSSQQQKSSRLRAKKLGLGTESDEEEEALIEEAERGLEETEKQGESVGVSASRFSMSLSRGQFLPQYSKTPINVRLLAPQDHIVINSCKVVVRLKQQYAFSSQPAPKTTWETKMDTHKYIQEWNNSFTYVHPKTCAHILKSMCVHYPAHVNMAQFEKLCDTKWHYQTADVQHMKTIHEEVGRCGQLGVKEDDLWVKFGILPNLEGYLQTLCEQRLYFTDHGTKFDHRTITVV